MYVVPPPETLRKPPLMRVALVDLGRSNRRMVWTFHHIILEGWSAAIVLKDRPIVYLFHRHWLWAHTAKLAGLRTIPDGLVRVQGLKLN